jgi:hypothetical protein
MSAAAHADRDIIDHLYRWSGAGRDGACPDPGRMGCRDALQKPRCFNPDAAFGRGPAIGTPDLLAPRPPWCRSSPAARWPIIKSP